MQDILKGLNDKQYEAVVTTEGPCLVIAGAGSGKTKVIFYVILSGITTGIGAFFGAIVGSISQAVIAVCLSFAAGAMLYIVSGELIPESNKLYKGRMSAIGNMIGFIIGIFATQL